MEIEMSKENSGISPPVSESPISKQSDESEKHKKVIEDIEDEDLEELEEIEESFVHEVEQDTNEMASERNSHEVLKEEEEKKEKEVEKVKEMEVVKEVDENLENGMGAGHAEIETVKTDVIPEPPNEEEGLKAPQQVEKGVPHQEKEDQRQRKVQGQEEKLQNVPNQAERQVEEEEELNKVEQKSGKNHLDQDPEDELVEDINEIANFIKESSSPNKNIVKINNETNTSNAKNKKANSKKRKRSKSRDKSKKSKMAKTEDEKSEQNESYDSLSVASGSNKNNKSFKPVQNWRKVMKMPIAAEDKYTNAQLYQGFLPTYIPHVPRGTSSRLIEYLSQRDVDLLCCPGCRDRFVMPNTFFQHIYRKSISISFSCQACDQILHFHNRCHLRMHVLSHMEVDGTSSVTSDFVDVTPLDKSVLSVGFVDVSYEKELDLTHKDVHLINQDLKQCTECKLSFGTDQLVKHFQKVERTKLYECDQCSISLLNECSLSAHSRIHTKLRPLVCPECGSGFETLSRFQSHVINFCHHDSKVATLRCQICVSRNSSDPIIEAKDVLSHVYDSHVKLFYKCSSCPKAFDSKVSIYEHRDSKHKEEKDEKPDFSLLYKAPFMKTKSNLFNSREFFEAKMLNVSRKWPLMIMYKCVSCQFYFPDGDMLRMHKKKSANCVSDQMPNLLFPCEKTEQKMVEKKKKLEDLLKQVRDLVSADCDHCDHSLVLLKSHIEDFHLATTKVKKVKKNIAEEEVEIKFEPSPQKPQRRRTLRSECVVKSTPEQPEKPPAAEPLPPPPAPPDKVEIKTEEQQTLLTPSPIKKSSTKSKKVKSKVQQPFVESLGIDVSSSNRRLAFNKLSKSALSLGSSVVKPVKKTNRFMCALCDFNSELRDSFQTHIRIHRPHNLDASNFIQCQECGMSFASEPGFKKHLFLLHRIKRPNPSHFCASLVSNESQQETVGNNKDVFTFSEGDEDDSGSSEPALTIDEEKEFKPRRNVCSVCARAFSTPLELRRHFRGHGMAFLMTSKK